MWIWMSDHWCPRIHTAELTQGKKKPMMKIPAKGPPTRLQTTVVASTNFSEKYSAANDRPIVISPNKRAKFKYKQRKKIEVKHRKESPPKPVVIRTAVRSFNSELKTFSIIGLMKSSMVTAARELTADETELQIKVDYYIPMNFTVINVYLRAAAKTAAVKRPGRPGRCPKISIRKSGKICEWRTCIWS